MYLCPLRIRYATPIKRAYMARPVKYKQEYCEMLINHMNDGFSFEAFGGVVGVDRATLHRWREKYQEFRDAFEVGYCKGLFQSEKIGRAAIMGKIPNFNTAAYCFWMKNRFGWSDKVDAKVEGTGSIQLTYSLIDGN